MKKSRIIRRKMKESQNTKKVTWYSITDAWLDLDHDHECAHSQPELPHTSVDVYSQVTDHPTGRPHCSLTFLVIQAVDTGTSYPDDDYAIHPIGPLHLVLQPGAPPLTDSATNKLDSNPGVHTCYSA
jgi:hypothetical protein